MVFPQVIYFLIWLQIRFQQCGPLDFVPTLLFRTPHSVQYQWWKKRNRSQAGSQRFQLFLKPTYAQTEVGFNFDFFFLLFRQRVDFFCPIVFFSVGIEMKPVSWKQTLEKRCSWLKENVFWWKVRVTINFILGCIGWSPIEYNPLGRALRGSSWGWGHTLALSFFPSPNKRAPLSSLACSWYCCSLHLGEDESAESI